jgi:hypothetical protein
MISELDSEDKDLRQKNKDLTLENNLLRQILTEDLEVQLSKEL